MLDEKFVIVGALINFIGATSYLLSTLKGKTKPNKVTWFLWALAPMIAFSAQIKQGVGWIALTTFMAGFNPILIFIASFVNKKSQWKISRLDITCGFLAVIGLLLWKVTQVPNLAILFSIIADGLAAVPTIVKSYTNPETENPNAYTVAAISGIIALLTIKTWDFAHFAFPVYIVIVCLILVILIQYKIGPKVKKLLLNKAKSAV